MSNGANIGATRFDALQASPSSAADRDPVDTASTRVQSDGSGSGEAAADDLRALRRDFDGLKEAVASFIAQTADKTVDAARGAASHFADQSSALAGRSADLAAEAGEQAKELAKELEQIARRNPLSAIAAAAAVGMLIGMMGRRR
jgi:ElaB/YqjD/DUF883 family membrane-anchored ribosome-binding protein